MAGVSQTAAAQALLTERPHIHVQGRGEVTARPDASEIDAAVVTEATSAAEAAERNRQIAARVLAALVAAQIPQQDIETISIEITPVRQIDPQTGVPGRIERFVVTNRIRIEVRNIDRTGQIIDRIVQAGVNTIFSVNFFVRDPAGLIEEAQRRAVREAQADAQIYARAAGVTLGRAIVIRELVEPAPKLFTTDVAGLRAEATPVLPGEQRFIVLIEAAFAIQ